MNKLLHAARLLVYVNGKLFGRCTSFQITSVTPRKKTHVVDIQHPVELGATMVDVGWTMGVLRTVGDGGMQGAGVIANQALLSREKYFTLQVIERVSGLVFFQSVFCQADNETWQVVAKRLLEGTVSGSSILWVNEAG